METSMNWTRVYIHYPLNMQIKMQFIFVIDLVFLISTNILGDRRTKLD